MYGGLASSSFPAPTLAGEADVFSALDRRLLTDRPVPIAVGLSGGGDSLALLRLAATWAEHARRPLLALTVDHGLNPDGGSWTRFAGARAAESGVAFRALPWEGDKPTTGLPAAARAARHALLARAAREAGASVILLGHTADDVAETDHMRSGEARGIGRLREWSPSPIWPEGRGVMLLRPMLGVRRAALRDWLAARGETWIDDPANQDPRFARARARAGGRSVGPAEPRPLAVQHETAVANLAKLFEDAGEGGLLLSSARLAAAPDGAALHVLSAAVLSVGGGGTPPRRAEAERLLARLRADPPRASTLCGARIERRGETIGFTREAGDRARNPRPDRDGVVDGRIIAGADGPTYLAPARFRAACFLIGSEASHDSVPASGRLPPRRPLA